MPLVEDQLGIEADAVDETRERRISSRSLPSGDSNSASNVGVNSSLAKSRLSASRSSMTTPAERFATRSASSHSGSCTRYIRLRCSYYRPPIRLRMSWTTTPLIPAGP
jgi:hypothetical protein